MSKQGTNSEHFAHENDALKQDIWTFTGDYTGFFATTSVTAPLGNNWTKKCFRYKLQEASRNR